MRIEPPNERCHRNTGNNIVIIREQLCAPTTASRAGIKEIGVTRDRGGTSRSNSIVDIGTDNNIVIRGEQPILHARR